MRRVAIAMLMLIPMNVLADNNHVQNSVNNSAQGGMGGTGLGGQGGSGFGGQGGTGGGGFGGNASGGDASALGGDASASSLGGSSSFHYANPRQSPSGFAFAPMPTATCQGTLGFFASFIGGLGFASSHSLKNCMILEEFRAALQLDQAIAREILCMAEFASQTTGCKK